METRASTSGKLFIIILCYFYQLPGRCVCCAKHKAKCERDPEKPKQRVCMKCARLKEQCKWPEVGGPNLVVDKGKGKVKEVTMSPQGGEKQKRKKMVAKVNNNNNIVEVPGPSGKQSRFDPGLFLHIMHLHCPIQHRQMKLTIGHATWPAEIGPSHGASPCHTSGLMVRCFTVPYWWADTLVH